MRTVYQETRQLDSNDSTRILTLGRFYKVEFLCLLIFFSHQTISLLLTDQRIAPTKTGVPLFFHSTSLTEKTEYQIHQMAVVCFICLLGSRVTGDDYIGRASALWAPPTRPYLVLLVPEKSRSFFLHRESLCSVGSDFCFPACAKESLSGESRIIGLSLVDALLHHP